MVGRLALTVVYQSKEEEGNTQLPGHWSWRSRKDSSSSEATTATPGAGGGGNGPSVAYQTTLVPRVLCVLSAQVCEDSEIDFVRTVASQESSGRVLIIAQDVHREHPKSTKENTVCSSLQHTTLHYFSTWYKSAQWGDLSRRVEDVQEPTMDDANDRLRFPFQTRCTPI